MTRQSAQRPGAGAAQVHRAAGFAQPLARVPDVTESGQPAECDFRLCAPHMKVKPMIANVRFAAGCRPAKDMLAAGKLVTHGIRKGDTQAMAANDKPEGRAMNRRVEFAKL
ncbi:MAG: hypothetical protein HOP12_03490 [Candidatus Eisenbacteria bacterium]|uniref:OmpA-like domain-containing protein n=1 Tax=Eiseniibacteriota bacterium TaxID=2212470 RepID=A0A849SKW7_UNCEI|nr:hypothetical protein [Candidatus Eisenbacteria bacterium]